MQFRLANLVVLLLGMLVIGAPVGQQIEAGVLRDLEVPRRSRSRRQRILDECLPRDLDAPPELQDDPRSELVNRLLEHEKFKSAAQMLFQKQQIEEAVRTNPAIREFMDAEGTEPEMAADVIDLVKTFQKILERARSRPLLEVDEEAVTVGQMIEFLRRRLALEERPIYLNQLLQSLNSRQSLVCMFLALLELVRLQAIQLRQNRLFGEILVRKHQNFDALLAETTSSARDDWR